MPQDPKAPRSHRSALCLAWLWVGLPLAWGVFETALKAGALFR
jgi:hypothetical protein